MSRRPYIGEASRSWWWLNQRRYIGYMIRELTCVFIGAYTGIIVVGLMRLSQGEAAYDGFLEALRAPVGIAFHAVAFIFALYHTASWFNVTPKAMPLRMGEMRVPGSVIIGAHYAGWLATSAVILYLVGG